MTAPTGTKSRACMETTPEARATLQSVISAFLLISDPLDHTLLVRVLTKLSPVVAEALVLLCTSGLEVATPEVRRQARAVARLSHSRDVLNTLLVPTSGNMDKDDPLQLEMDILRTYGTITEKTECQQLNGRFKQYRCDVPIQPDNTTCGLNAGAKCERGTGLGTRYCTVGPSGKCKLVQTELLRGPRDQLRTDVNTHTAEALRRFNALRS